jgi:hypothetical protein
MAETAAIGKRHLRRAALAWAAEELHGATGQGLEAPEEAAEEILRLSGELRRRAGIPDDARCFTWDQAVAITAKEPQR